MQNVEIHIQSYFSIETDLASEFSTWREFIKGQGYDVLLRSGEEEVSIKYVIEQYEDAYVRVKSNINGVLFQRVLGGVTYLLSKHSDNLIIRGSNKSKT